MERRQLCCTAVCATVGDDADADFWSISWQPVGKPLDQAKYVCRHGLSYSKYLCDYRGKTKSVADSGRGKH